MSNAPLSAAEVQAAQVFLGLTMAAFIGGRLLPPRFRQIAGLPLAACYLAGVAAFVLYALYR